MLPLDSFNVADTYDTTARLKRDAALLNKEGVMPYLDRYFAGDGWSFLRGQWPGYPESSEALLRIAMVHLMLQRLQPV